MRSRTVAIVPCLCAAALAVLAVLGTAPAARAATVLRGINDGALSALGVTARDQHLHEIRSELRASVLRVDCQWPLAEPAKGQYSDSDAPAMVWSAVSTRSAAATSSGSQ